MHYFTIFAVIIAISAIKLECATSKEFRPRRSSRILNPAELEELMEGNGTGCLLFEGPTQAFPCALDVVRDVIVDKLNLPQLKYKIDRATRMNNGSILFDVGSNADIVQIEALKVFSKSKVFRIKSGNCHYFEPETKNIPDLQKRK